MIQDFIELQIYINNIRNFFWLVFLDVPIYYFLQILDAYSWLYSIYTYECISHRNIEIKKKKYFYLKVPHLRRHKYNYFYIIHTYI